MILDAGELPEGQGLTADLCIVGAGAAGISLALSLVRSGLDVLLLEAGGERAEAATQALYEGSVTDGKLHCPPDRYRQRRFGGSTTIWGGRCNPFDEIDFETRAYVPHSGWPIRRDDVAAYYPRANALCEAGEYAYTAEAAFDRPLRPMIGGLRSEHFSTHTLERFSCPTDFGARYAHKLRAAANLRVVLHANVTQLHLNPAGQTLHAATVRTLGGRCFQVSARWFVLATGGLEVARLLLASRDVHRQGIGNQHDVVGRYYMCHLAGSMGSLVFSGPRHSIWHGYDVADDGVYCRRRLALTADTQRRLGIGNFVARLHHPRITDPVHRTGILSLLYLARAFIPYEYGKRLHDDEGAGFAGWFAHLRNVALDPLDTAAFLWHWLRERSLAARKFPSIVVRPRVSRYSLDFHAEQQPNPASRVMLGDDVDALGMPRLRIDWRYSRGDVETVQRALALLARDIAGCGVGRFDYDPHGVEFEMTRYGAYGGHHIGTARMGSDPRSSVVDTQGRVHGVDNLFVAGSAVFPTSSQANPTLTIVALALRLADHLQMLDRRVVPLFPSEARANMPGTPVASSGSMKVAS